MSPSAKNNPAASPKRAAGTAAGSPRTANTAAAASCSFAYARLTAIAETSARHSPSSNTRRLGRRLQPDRAGDTRAAEPAIAVRVLREVLLVVRLRVVERPRLGELRRDLAVARARELGAVR